MHYHLARLLRDAGKPQEARREVLRSLEEAPRFREAHRLLLELVEPDSSATTSKPSNSHPEDDDHDPTTAGLSWHCLCVLAIAAGGVPGPAVSPRPRGRRNPVLIPDDRAGVPNWKVDERFKKDVFTFVRIEYDSGGGFGRGGSRRWLRRGFRRRPAVADDAEAGAMAAAAAGLTDFPDSDLNFSFRLQQLTSLKVNPEPITMRLTDDRLFDYPFIYIIEPGGCLSRRTKGPRLRQLSAQRRLLDGRRLLGRRELDNFLEQMKQHVFPEDKYEPKSCRSSMRSSAACIASRRSRRSPASTPGSGPRSSPGKTTAAELRDRSTTWASRMTRTG